MSLRASLYSLGKHALAPRVAAAVRDRMRRVLAGDGAEPQQRPDEIQAECIRRHGHMLSPHWAFTFLGGPLNILVYAAQDSSSHCLRRWPLRLAVAFFEACDPTVSATHISSAAA